MDASTTALALGLAFALIVSFAALGAGIWALLRPRDELGRIHKRVLELGALRAEWEEYRSNLDSIVKRLVRFSKVAELGQERKDGESPGRPHPGGAGGPGLLPGRRRSLSLTELTGGSNAARDDRTG